MSDYVSLSAVQAARKAALLAGLAVGLALVAFTRAAALGHDVHELVELVGLALLVVCILGRVWCSLYIGGAKVRRLVTNGPYSVVRNPLYVFSLIGAAGVGAQAGSIVLTLLCPLVAWLVFEAVIRKEEQALLAVHGEAYEAYRRSTPRLLPNASLWWDYDALTVRPVRVMVTFLDGLVFLLAIPVAEGLEQLQSSGVLPIIANLP